MKRRPPLLIATGQIHDMGAMGKALNGGLVALASEIREPGTTIELLFIVVALAEQGIDPVDGLTVLAVVSLAQLASVADTPYIVVATTILDPYILDTRVIRAPAKAL